MIYQQFKEVIKHSQKKVLARELPDLDFSLLFKNWETKKKIMISTLPFFTEDKLIYEFPEPVECGISLQDKKERLNKFIKELWNYPDVQEFLSFNKENFFTNRNKDTFEAPYGTVQKNMKIIKALKMFFDDKDTLKTIQDEASVIMNQEKIKGTFCISIHPLDYISISDNDNNWSSCHSLDSDYKAGNLSYMADKHTIICYVKTGKDRQITNFPKNIPWNSKSWRALLFISQDAYLTMAGKQYPITCDEILNYVQKSFRQALNLNKNEYFNLSPWHKGQVEKVTIDGYDYTLPYSCIPFGSQVIPIHKIFVPGAFSQQYNDILTSGYKKEVRYAYLTSKNYFKNLGCAYDETYSTNYVGLNSGRDNNLTLTIGEGVVCPVCGIHYIQTSNLFLCDRCAIKYYKTEYLEDNEFYVENCSICGEPYNSVDLYYDEKGYSICPDCCKKYKCNGGINIWQHAELLRKKVLKIR